MFPLISFVAPPGWGGAAKWYHCEGSPCTCNCQIALSCGLSGVRSFPSAPPAPQSSGAGSKDPTSQTAPLAVGSVSPQQSPILTPFLPNPRGQHVPQDPRLVGSWALDRPPAWGPELAGGEQREETHTPLATTRAIFPNVRNNWSPAACSPSLLTTRPHSLPLGRTQESWVPSPPQSTRPHSPENPRVLALSSNH